MGSVPVCVWWMFYEYLIGTDRYWTFGSDDDTYIRLEENSDIDTYQLIIL